MIDGNINPSPCAIKFLPVDTGKIFVFYLRSQSLVTIMFRHQNEASITALEVPEWHEICPFPRGNGLRCMYAMFQTATDISRLRI